MIEVSVFIIVYNHSKYLRQCLDSVLMQKTTFDFEVLIYDDASVDGSQDIIKEYESRYPDIINTFCQKENQYSKGCLKMANQKVINKAKGKYMALCEGDDYWTDPCKLQRQYDFMESHPEYSVCMHRAKIIDEGGEPLGLYLGPKGVDKDILFEEDVLRFFATASKFFRTHLMCNPPDFYYFGDAGDYPQFIILLANGKGYYMKEEMCVYRRNVPGSSSTVLHNQSLEQRISHQEVRIEQMRLAQEYYRPKYFNEFNRYIALQQNALIQEYDSVIDKIKFYLNMKNKECYRRLDLKTKIMIFSRSFFLKPYTFLARMLKKV